MGYIMLGWGMGCELVSVGFNDVMVELSSLMLHLDDFSLFLLG